MIKHVFIDTNVLLDYLLARKEGGTEATQILLLGNAHVVDLLVCDLSIANIAYITRKEVSHEDFYKTMEGLLGAYSIVPMGQEVVSKALSAKWQDFEDSLQYYSAIQAKADLIITRNTKDFANSQIPVYTPAEFLNTVL